MHVNKKNMYFLGSDGKVQKCIGKSIIFKFNSVGKKYRMF